ILYDRLEPLGMPKRAGVHRVLIDLRAEPELERCSRLLWRLRRLLPGDVARPITGALELGERSLQESWDVALGRNQRALIELGYEGVTVEQVLEQRLRAAAWAPKATAASALEAVEEAVLLLDSPRLTEELGERAVQLLSTELTADGAPEVLRRFRRLLGHYRATEPALPKWCEAFVTTGFAHYCTMLPTSFTDEETGIRQVAAMLGFLLTMENTALALGCERTQLELAVKQSHPAEPAKTALLWAAESRLDLLPLAELRRRCTGLLDNPLVVPAFPQYLSGFVQALSPVPMLAPFVVEVISDAFARLPDRILLPWLPTLITTLREHAGEMVPVLLREAGRTFPAALDALDAWTPPWTEPEAPAADPVRAVPAGPVADLLTGHPAASDAVAALLGVEAEWPAAAPGAGAPAHPEAAALLDRHPVPAEAVAALLG